MITKVLFTLAVIAVVMLVFRHKSRPPDQTRGAAALPGPGAEPSGIGPRTLAYSLAGLLALVSAGIYWLVWTDQHRVVTIHVIDGASGESVTYQAYKKTIEGRNFETLDGRRVALGSDDRIELVEGR